MECILEPVFGQEQFYECFLIARNMRHIGGMSLLMGRFYEETHSKLK